MGETNTEPPDLLGEYRTLRQRAIETPEARLVVFVDLVGSTAYKEQRGALEGALRCEYHNRLVSEIASRYDLVRVKSLGDGVMLQMPVGDGAAVSDRVKAFAIACLTSPERATLAEQPRIESRIGIALGRVVLLPDGDMLGPAVDLAARLQGLAKPGQAIAEAQILGAAKRRSNGVRTVMLKGIEAPVDVVEVVGDGLACQGVTPQERWRDYRFVVSIHPMSEQSPDVRKNWLRAVVDLSYRAVLRSRRLEFLALEPGPAFAAALSDPDVFSCFSVPLAILNNRRLVDEVFKVTSVQVSGFPCEEEASSAPSRGPVFSRRTWRVPSETGPVGTVQSISYCVNMVTKRSQPLFTMIAEYEVINPTYGLHLSGLAGAHLSFAAHFPPKTRYEVSFHPDRDSPTGIELRVDGAVPPGSGVTFLWNDPVRRPNV